MASCGLLLLRNEAVLLVDMSTHLVPLQAYVLNQEAKLLPFIYHLTWLPGGIAENWNNNKSVSYRYHAPINFAPNSLSLKDGYYK